MLAGMTTPGIVPIHPIRQLSGRIIPKKLIQTGAIQMTCPVSRHYPFFLASVEHLFPTDAYDFLPTEDDNV